MAITLRENPNVHMEVVFTNLLKHNGNYFQGKPKHAHMDVVYTNPLKHNGNYFYPHARKISSLL